MKKRVLSLFLTFVLSFSMMPMSAFAEGTGAVAEQEAQSSGDTAYVSTTGEDVSGGDAANEDASNKDTAVEAAQALIDALPEEVTAENADELQAQLMAIDEALAELSEEQAAGLDMTRYEKICAALNAPALVAEQDSGHTEADHANMIPWEATDSLPNTAGSYYLTKDVTLTAGWEPKSGIVLCLNGKSITLNAEGDVINMSANGTIFTLYDCQKSGTITHGKDDSTDTTYNGCGVVVGGTFNMYGGNITGNVRTGSGNGGGVLVSYGIFNMYDGKITNNSCGSSGGGVYVDRGTFNMSGGEISSNTSGESGGGIELYNKSDFTMTGGSIRQNKAENDCCYGGGIDVSYGSTFTMNGGTITDNMSYTGGGVYVGTAVGNYGNNTFHMNGGAITDNTATTTGYQPGGGVYVPADGIFTMSGAVKITDNKNNGVQNNIYLFDNTITITGALGEDASIGVTTPSVAVVGSPVTIAKGDGYTLTDDDAARFTSDAGYYPELDGTEVKLYKNQPQKHPICGETCTHDGIHSALVWEGITELADATKAGNYYLMNSVTRTTNGSWFCNNDVNLCLNGYSITAEHDSYTIRVQKGAKLTLTDCGQKSGTITHGSSNTGSGVMVNNGCSFTMYGGTICGNTATASGSGVVVDGGSSFTMYGGAITGNNTTGDVSCGGVYVISTGTFTVSGAAKIQNNWKNGTLQNGVYVQGSGTASNVCLTADTTITIGEGLTEDACIGVSKSLPVTKADNVRMAAGAAKELDYKKIFPLDENNPYYSVIRDDDGNLSIHLHEHGWKYQLRGDGATVTAVCNDAATCPTDGGNGGSVTLKAPAADMLTYDGTAKSVTLDGRFVEDKTIPTEVNVTYRAKDGDVLEGAPVNAGTYTASITCIGADDKSVTASVDYTIEKATLTAGDFTFTPPANLVYDGEAKYATVSSTKINGNYIHVEYEDASGTLDQAIKAGTYKVLVTANGDPNYNEASQLSDPAWTFTIQKAKPVIQLTASTQTLVKNGKAVDISGWASFNNTDSGAELTYMLVDEPEGITLSADNKLTAASGTTTTGFDIQITATATDNFEAPAAATIHVAVVEKQDAGVSITGAPTGKIYGDSDFVVTATKTAPDGGTWSWSSSDSDILEIVSGGNTATPTVRVKNAGAAGAILTASYSDDTYYGIANVTIIVNPKKITADMISDVPAQEYTGSAITPELVVKDGGVALISGTDFDSKYDNNTNAGENTATVTINGKGNYKGTASRTFTISPKDVKGAVITLQADSLGYTGLMQEVQITSVTLNQVPLTTNDYYIVNNSNKQISADASITLTIAGKGNYTGTATTTWKITKATPELGNFDVTPELSQKQTYDGKPKEVTAQPKNGVIGMGAVTVCYEGSNGTTYPRSKTAPTNAGTYQVILTVAEGKNYTAAEIEAGTLTIEKADLTVEDVTEFFEYTKKGEQTINVSNLVPGARSYALDAYTNDNGIVSGDITIDATGLMKFALSELTKDNIDNKVTVPVTITSENYKDVRVNVIIYISPEYRIIDSANSSWTQNTDGTVVIRGNGEFSRFHAVKVDGKVIDPANYEAKEGSTIITLKAEYLKTLATGSHTFAIVWNNGIAGTNFTVAANTSGNNSGNNSNNNDSNHGSHNSGNNDSGNTAGTAANTAAASAQELDKVPATGDASGIWLTLFVISLTGLAAMLARRKKN